jgi:hypothetical protein
MKLIFFILEAFLITFVMMRKHSTKIWYEARVHAIAYLKGSDTTPLGNTQYGHFVDLQSNINNPEFLYIRESVRQDCSRNCHILGNTSDCVIDYRGQANFEIIRVEAPLYVPREPTGPINGENAVVIHSLNVAYNCPHIRKLK